ncbi:MAG: EAL domain-containing protein [Treponema sp.]|nr:EAL domain-containing protein [Treponema sp.]
MTKYFYHFDIAAIIISLAVFITFFRKKTISTRVIKAFIWLTVGVIMASLTDILSIVCLDHSDKVPIWQQYIINMLYHISFLSIPYSFFYCMYYAIHENQRPKVLFLILTALPFIISVIFIIYSPVTHFIFYFDSDAVYYRGSIFFVLYVVSGAYILLSIIQSIRYRNTILLTALFSTYFLVFSAIVALVFQFFYPEYMTMNFILSSSVVFVYLSLENPLDYFDTEMQIFNRDGFIVMERQKLEKNAKISAICIKINDFDYLEEAIGKENFLSLVKNISQQIKEYVNKKNIFRLQKDKIAIILNNMATEQKEELKNIQNIFNSPIKYGKNSKEITLSVQINQIDCPNDAVTVLDMLYLLENSFDENSYKKLSLSEKGINQVLPVNTILLETKHHNELIANFLKEALELDKFEVVYQPIFSIQKQKYVAVEAFLRIKDFRFDSISPDEFIPIAENYGLILQIGDYVLNKSMDFMNQYTLYDFGIETIHINLSNLQCTQQKIYKQFFNIMKQKKLDCKYVCFNVKENTIKNLDKTSKENLEMAVQNHSSLALDNFGYENVNVEKIIEMPFDSVKIDKAMVWKACSDYETKIILENNIQMFKAMKLKVTAVGVETEEQAATMVQLGCDFIQGNYYSMPLTEKNLFTFIKKNS